MKKVLTTLTFACALTTVSQFLPAIKYRPLQQQTITIYYCACTDGGDFSVDSGEVIVPERLREAYIDERCKKTKLYGTTREVIIKRAASNGYRVSSLRSATVAAWDSLFTPSGRSSSDPIPENEDRAIQGGYWRRRYRVSGTVIGLKGPYLVFKIQKAVRIADNNYEEK